MEYISLGKTDIRISRITHGCMELAGGYWKELSKEHNIELLQNAAALGVTTFDTAEMYGDGNSERIVGEALRGKRQDCIIATKIMGQNLRFDAVKEACERSLKNLQTDYIDLLYVHWPNPEVPLEETMAAFKELKQQGKIRAIGVSNFSFEQVKEAAKYAQLDAVQPEYNLLERTIEDGLLNYCAENKISVFSYNSIAKGILTGAFHFKNAKLDADDFRREKPLFSAENLKRETPLLEKVKEIAEQHEVTVGQVSIAWILAQRGMSSAVIGTQNLAHLKDNMRAIDVKLTAEEILALDQASKAVLATLSI